MFQKYFKIINSFLGLFVLLFSYPLMGQQSVEVTGVVLDAAGQSIPGANVVVKSTDGSVSGASTDLDGKFTVTAAPGSKVTVTFLGKIAVDKTVPNESVDWNIVLQDDAQELSEVVITALGIKKEKKSLGYSVQEVKSDAVTENRATNMASSLSGKLSGVRIQTSSGVGGSANVVIRGASSVSGSNQPLYVIDGTPILNSNFGGGAFGGSDLGNTAQDISPDDIESISVLKGPAASALYGNRAANGVILITTKKGKGSLLNVSVNSTVEFATIQPSSLPQFQYEYGGGGVGYSTYPTEAHRLGLSVDDALSRKDELGLTDAQVKSIQGLKDKGRTYVGFDSWEAPDGKKYPLVDYAEDASWGPKLNPDTKVLHWDAYDSGDKRPWSERLRSWSVPDNKVEEFFDVGRSFRNNISISGRGKKIGYRISYSNLDQTSILPNSSLERNNFTGNFSADVNKYLTITANANYVNTKGNGRPVVGYDGQNVFQQMFQWTQMQIDYKRLKNYKDAAGNQLSWNRTSPDNSFPKYADNPNFIRQDHLQRDERDRMISNLSLVGKPLDWVTVTGRLSLDFFSYLAEVGAPLGSNELPHYGKYAYDYSERNSDLIINAEKPVHEKITVKGLVGFNHRKNIEKVTGILTEGGLVFKDFWSIDNTLSPQIGATDQTRESEFYSTYLSLGVSWDDMVFLEGTSRWDWSSTLPVANNPFFYGSISSSFVFSELLPQNVKDVINYGKVRASLAQVGKGTDPYATQNVYSAGNFGSSKLTYRPSTLANADLRPENTVGIEFGWEFSFYDRIATFEGAWYKRSTTDQILRLPVSKATGYNQIYVNAGEIENTGVELSLTLSPLKKLDLPVSWDITINWAKNVNKVVKLLDGLSNYQIETYQTTVSLNATEGQPLGTIIGSKFKRDAQGRRIVGENGYYVVPKENGVIGDMNPDWIGGLGNRITYTDENLGTVSLYGLIDTKWGGDIYSVSTYYGHFAGNYFATTGTNDLGNDKRAVVKPGDPKSGGVILAGVTEDGKPNTVRVPVGYNLYSRMPRENWIYDATYVKLRELSFSYSLPNNLLNVWGLKGASLTLSGRNLFILHKNTDHIDPEVSYGTSLAASGAVEPTFLPSERYYAISVGLKF